MVQVTEWINKYTAIVETDAVLSVGQDVSVPSKDIEVDSLWKRLRVWVGRLFTPDYRQYNVHLDEDMLDGRVIGTRDGSYVVEVYGEIKYYPSF